LIGKDELVFVGAIIGLIAGILTIIDRLLGIHQKSKNGPSGGSPEHIAARPAEQRQSRYCMSAFLPRQEIFVMGARKVLAEQAQ